MRHTVAIVKSVSGNVVKKSFEFNTEIQLNSWDLIKLDDYIWARSLDAQAVLALHGAEFVIKPGMRVKFDKEFLQNMPSGFCFLDKNDIDEIVPKELRDSAKDALKKEISGDMQSKDELGILVFSKDKLVSPSIKNSRAVYECEFSDIIIKIEGVKGGREVKFYDIDMKNLIDKKFADKIGDAQFNLSNLEQNTELGYSVMIEKDDGQLFKREFIIFVNSALAPKEKFIKNLELVFDYPKDESLLNEKVNISVDVLAKRTYDISIDIDYIFKLNQEYPVFKFSSKEDVVVKAYLVGFSDYIFDEPQELNGLLEKGDNGEYRFAITSKFQIPGSYIVYFNFLSQSNKTVLDEIFCKFDIKFKNANLIKIEKLENGFLYGHGADSNSEIAIYSVDLDNSFKKIASMSSDKSGKFNLDVEFLKQYVTNGRIAIREIDIYKNKSIATWIEI